MELVLCRDICCGRAWPSQELAQMLIGEHDAGGTSLMESAGFAFGCLQPAMLEEVITRAGLVEVHPLMACNHATPSLASREFSLSG